MGNACMGGAGNKGGRHDGKRPAATGYSHMASGGWRVQFACGCIGTAVKAASASKRGTKQVRMRVTADDVADKAYAARYTLCTRHAK